MKKKKWQQKSKTKTWTRKKGMIYWSDHKNATLRDSQTAV